MLFGKIDYLNLVPFHVFLKGLPLQSSFKKSIEYKKGVPSALCKQLYDRRIDAAVISSIESRRARYKTLGFGIVANREVKSVLVRKNSALKLDPASMSSNMLARVLGLSGEVIIGDRALKAYLREGSDKFYDLGAIWYERTGLPFVFARFCYVKNGTAYKKIVKKFLSSRIKIPNYILRRYAQNRGVSAKQIEDYLSLISYEIGKKQQRGYEKFIRSARALGFDPLG